MLILGKGIALRGGALLAAVLAAVLAFPGLVSWWIVLLLAVNTIDFGIRTKQ